MTIYIKQGHHADNYKAIEVSDPFQWLEDKIKTAPTIDEKVKAEYIISGKMQPQPDGTYYRNDESLIARDLIMIDYDFNNGPQDHFTISHDDFKAEVSTKLRNAKYMLYPTFNADDTKVRYRLILKPERALNRQEYKVMAAEVVKLINLPTDKSSIVTWSQAQGAPVKSPKNAHLSHVIQKQGKEVVIYPKSVIDTKLDEIERFAVESPLLNNGRVTKNAEVTHHNIKISNEKALQIMTDYIEKEEKNGSLLDYNNSLSAILTLAKSVQNDSINIETARECVSMLALGNTEWERNNLDKLERELKNNIRTPYDFIGKFVIASGNASKYKELLDQVNTPNATSEIRAEIDATDLSNMTINNVPNKWLQHLTDAEISELHKNTSPSRQLDNFFKDLDTKLNNPPVSTGFAELDAILDGGLYTGLYFIGAISSLGKTTFLLQMADQIAKQGKDVLIFSLEMSRYEIMSKTLSRLTYEISSNDKADNPEGRAFYRLSDGGGKIVWNARTVRQITDKRRYNGYTDSRGDEHKPYTDYQKGLINQAAQEYKTFADHIFIHEGVGDIGAKEIRDAVEIHTKMNGNAPIVILDYLQILEAENDRSSDKQNTDKAVVELKRISRDFDTPVMAISSLNRENYSKGISMLAFKESGAIEYSSDVLIGLQFAAQRKADIDNKGISEKSKDYVRVDVDAEKQKDPREIELKILKQRNGQATGSLDFYYRPKFNYYEETTAIGDTFSKSSKGIFANSDSNIFYGKKGIKPKNDFIETPVGDGVFKITNK